MTKQNILQKLFFASPTMVAHLSEPGNCDSHDLLNAVCGAPISLQRKLEMLLVCSVWDLGVRSGKFDQNEECSARIAVIEQALLQLDASPGDVFLWRNCWYDRDWRDSDIGRSGFEPCLSIADVYAAIDAFIADEAELLTEEEIAEGVAGDVGWYEIQKWEQRIGDDGKPHLVKSPWEYIYADHQLCYFTRQLSQEERHDWPKCRLWQICDGSSDLNLSIPFQPGDLVTIDCRPFAPVQHAVLLEIGRGCCDCQIAFVDATGKLQSAALKHSHCFTDDYLSKLSPLYRLSLYKDELEGNEKILAYLRNSFLSQKPEYRNAFGFDLWTAISNT